MPTDHAIPENHQETTQPKPPRTDAQIETSRSNGAKSKGPTTPEGRAISSKNALKHGFAAEINILIAPENSDAWHTHLAGIHESYRPTNYAERDLVDQIASIRWRQARLVTIETAHLAFQFAIQEQKVNEFHPLEKDNPNLHLVLAWQGLARKAYPRPLPADPSIAPDPTQPPDSLDIESIELLRRYQTSLDRQFRNALVSLRQYRKDFGAPIDPLESNQIVAQQNEPKPALIFMPNPPDSTPASVQIIPKLAA